MKINEKHLISFATSNSPTDKEGWLLKRGEVNKSFQRRWFVLKGNLLFYFEKKQDKEPIGVIILEGCTVELAVTTDDSYFTFELVFQGSTTRTYIMAAESQEDMECWMKAITCAGYEYLKLMVTELQRQLDEVTMLNTNSLRWSNSQSETDSRKSTPNDNAALIDISNPDHFSGRQPRVNPFNKEASLDQFGATPFNPTHSMSQSHSQGFRSFEEMHKTYGFYIRQKFLQKKPNQFSSDA